MSMDRSELTTEEVLRRDIPWETYMTTKLISGTGLQLLRRYDNKSESQRAALLDDDGPAYVAVFVNILRDISKEETVEYVLALIDEILAANPKRARIFHDRTLSGSDIYGPFLKWLWKGNWFIQEKSCKTLSLIISVRPKFQAGILSNGEAANMKSIFTSADDVLKGLVEWLCSQLKNPSHPYRAVPTAINCLAGLLKESSVRASFVQTDSVKLLVPLISPASTQQSIQLLYETCLCVWLLSYYDAAVDYLATTRVLPRLIEVVKGSTKEKVVRVVILTFRNLLSKGAFGAQMVDLGLLQIVLSLKAQSWSDEQIGDLICYSSLNRLIEHYQFFVSSVVMSSVVSTSRRIHLPSNFGSLGSQNRETPSASSGQPEMDPQESEETELLSVSWNQDNVCFAAGTSHGFRIYSCSPFKETFRRELKSGGFGIVEMLFRCNILALVGGGANSQYPPNKVLIWDDYQGRCIGEFAFRSNVRGVKLRRDRIVMVLEHKIYVHSMTDLKLLHQIETLANPKGLCCLSHHSSTSVLACPGLHQGQVRIEHFGLKVTKFINAHDSHISCFSLTLDGFLLATTSVKGTLVRIFNTMDGTRLQEVRRGADRAEIYSIALSPNVQWLAISSDKGTVHIFNLRVRVVGEDAPTAPSGQGLALLHQNSATSLDALISPNTGANPSSSLSFMRGVLPRYFSSEWSFAQFRLPEVTRYFVAFGSENTVMIVGMDGSFYRCSFDPVVGGQMTQQEYIRFLKLESPEPRPSVHP